MTPLAKAKKLERATQFNFSNWVLGQTCHFEELAKHSESQHYITDYYDRIMAELTADPKKASPALATLATSGSFSNEEFKFIIDEAQKATPAELKEFFNLRETHVGSGHRMIDYMCFPVVVRMTKNIPSKDRIDFIALKPEMMEETVFMENALTELTKEERLALIALGTEKQKNNMSQKWKMMNERLHVSEFAHGTGVGKDGKLFGARIWLVCVKAQARFADIRDERKAAQDQAKQAQAIQKRTTYPAVFPELSHQRD